MRHTLSTCLVLALAAAGCGKNGAVPSGDSNVAFAAGHAASTPAAKSPANAVDSLASSDVTGTVLETIDSGGYTYMRLKVVGGEEWAAVRETKVKKGESVTVTDAMVMRDFESKTLHRKFDHILFGTLAASGASADPHASSAGMAMQHAQAAAGPQEAADVKVPKAEGKDARTVAQVFAQKAALKDQTVTVRGKVVKSNSGIMGRNWLHVRDGSGSAAGKDNDLTVTSVQDGASVGDVVTVKGTVHVDRDFGAGYAYPVILEDASVAK
jgi:hypothetical protein